MTLSVRLIHPGSLNMAGSRTCPWAGTMLSILLPPGVGLPWVTMLARFWTWLAISMYAAAVRCTGSSSSHTLMPAELVFAVSLAPRLKAATDQRRRATGPLSPSLATMCLHELAASSKMSSKSSSMKLRMWLLSSQHGFLTNLGIGSRHTFMASAAASSSMVWVWLGLEGGDRHPHLVQPHQNRASKDVND